MTLAPYEGRCPVCGHDNKVFPLEALQSQPTAQPAVPEGWKLLKDTTQDERSYPEDIDQESGGYYNVCCHCLRMFVGHKRRVICKSCAALTAAPTPPVAVARPTDDQLWDQTLSERDHYHEVADQLANAIAEHFSIEIGEHSSANCPWDNALNAIEERTYSDAEALRKDAERLDWLQQHDGRFYNIDRIAAIVGDGFSSNGFRDRTGNLRIAIDAAMKEKP